MRACAVLHVDALPLSERIVCKVAIAQVITTWLLTSRASAEAGHRAGKTGHDSQRNDNRAECKPCTSAQHGAAPPLILYVACCALHIYLSSATAPTRTRTPAQTQAQTPTQAQQLMLQGCVWTHVEFAWAPRAWTETVHSQHARTLSITC